MKMKIYHNTSEGNWQKVEQALKHHVKAQIATIDVRYGLKYRPSEAPKPKLIGSSTSKKGKLKPIPKHLFKEVTDDYDPFHSPPASSLANKKPKTMSTTKLTANMEERIHTKKGTTHEIVQELHLY
jgi:hypothetical protein